MQKTLWLTVLAAFVASILWLGMVGIEPKQHQITKSLTLNL